MNDFVMIIHYIPEENIFCRYCLHDFITEEILKPHKKDYFNIHGKETIKMSKKGEYLI